MLAGAYANSTMLTVIGGIAALAAGVAGFRKVGAPGSTPAKKPRKSAGEDTGAPTGTVLFATLRNVNGSERLASDLHRILAGIVADERGSIDRAEEHELVASFAKSDHAVHAAQRMLSNVDAVGRRLGNDLSIAIGVDETLDGAARVQSATTSSVPVLVSEASARLLGNQLERVDTGVFTFPPAQRRLPGF